jgi:hypothetical protein
LNSVTSEAKAPVADAAPKRAMATVERKSLVFMMLIP